MHSFCGPSLRNESQCIGTGRFATFRLACGLIKHPAVREINPDDGCRKTNLGAGTEFLWHRRRRQKLALIPYTMRGRKKICQWGPKPFATKYIVFDIMAAVYYELNNLVFERKQCGIIGGHNTNNFTRFLLFCVKEERRKGGKVILHLSTRLFQ